jgi:hypothetical protein
MIPLITLKAKQKIKQIKKPNNSSKKTKTKTKIFKMAE